ncbi:hypothetical protein LSTR_LSTR007512 [Laodelphax striatellus]|uniref:Uncharacterized protein n=1 Tax=Laodelphax striatellus TaxID=195883 RepID=A0A482X429_LAOST|nr:hypothetical protein LSTR_LSTR007512 [Laodelphax striatellus]
MSLCRFFATRNICHHFPIVFRLNTCFYRHLNKDVGDLSSTNNILDYYCDSFFISNTPKIHDKNTPQYRNSVNSDNLLKLFDKLSDEEILLEINQMAKEKRSKDAADLLKLCVKKQINLSVSFLVYIVKLFSRIGEKQGLEVAIEQLRISDNDLYEKENGFKHYTAQSSWMQGNFVHSTRTFMEILEVNTCFSPSEKLVLQTIISDSISTRGEAALFIMKEFVEDISKTHGDYFPMVMFWQHLFESEWFADQQLSKELLKGNQKLLDHLHWIIPMWSYRLLKNHKTDVVFRLCQVLLEYNHIDCYSLVLHHLFDYYCNRGDVKKCTTIMKNALDLNITMKEVQQKRFLILLTTGKPDSISETSETKSSKMKIDLHF